MKFFTTITTLPIRWAIPPDDLCSVSCKGDPSPFINPFLCHDPCSSPFAHRERHSALRCINR